MTARGGIAPVANPARFSPPMSLDMARMRMARMLNLDIRDRDTWPTLMSDRLIAKEQNEGRDAMENALGVNAVGVAVG